MIHPLKIGRLAEEGRLSGAVVHGGLVWLAGQVADDATLDAEGQTADILAQIDALLHSAGTSKANLLSMQIILADMNDGVVDRYAAGHHPFDQQRHGVFIMAEGI